MDLKVEVFSHYCAPSVFFINGQEGYQYDFGESFDASPASAEPYGCGNRVFKRKPATPEVLEQYSITQESYDEICDVLEEKLSFGRCCWCA